MSRFHSIWTAALLVCAVALQASAQPAAEFGLRLLPLGSSPLAEAAQVPASPGQVAPVPKLFIQILDGEGAVNNIKARTAREPVVEVDDENHKPVAGALVTFFAPNNNGAGGLFANQQTLTVMTDAQGRAVGRGFHPNSTSGQFAIEVTAAFAGVIAKAIISQTNSSTSGEGNNSGGGSSGKITGTRSGLFSGKMLIILAVAAGATAGIIYAVTSGGGTPTATITGPGSPVVSGTHP